MKNIARVRKDIVLKSQSYAELIRKAEKVEISMNQEIDNVKKRYNKKIILLKNIIKELSNDIKTLVSANKEFIFKDDKRCLDLNFIVVGFRRSSEIHIPTTQKDDIIQYIEDNNLVECLDIKKSVKKSILSSWSDLELSKIGVVRKYKDNFYIDIKKDDLLGGI